MLKLNQQIAFTAIHRVITPCVLITLLILSLPTLAQETSVTQLAPDVYHFRYGFHSNLFIVTDEGVIATDPLSPEAAKACLRFSGIDFHAPSPKK